MLGVYAYNENEKHESSRTTSYKPSYSTSAYEQQQPSYTDRRNSYDPPTSDIPQVSSSPSEIPELASPDTSTAHADTAKSRGFFTVGSTKDDVLAVQGTPTQLTADVFSYGYSTVTFRNDRVVTWYIASINPLKAKLLPSEPTERRAFFTVGSTKNDVLATQGTPTEFSSEVYKYGYSSVTFRNGRVASWYIASINPLKAKLLSASSKKPAFFTVGSTKDEVLAVQGTPTEFSENVFTYGYSKVVFRDDKVVSWYIASINPLRAKLLPSQAMKRPAFFSVGSTKDDVLAVQGTPTKFSEDVFEYGYSSVTFRDGRVITWSNSSVNPLKAKLSPPQ